MNLCRQRLAAAWAGFETWGHPLELGHEFLESVQPDLVKQHNAAAGLAEPMPHLSALVCASAFDLAVHDAFGTLHQMDPSIRALLQRLIVYGSGLFYRGTAEDPGAPVELAIIFSMRGRTCSCSGLPVRA